MTQPILYRYPWKSAVIGAVLFGLASTFDRWFRGSLATPRSLLVHAVFMTLGSGILGAILARMRLGQRNQKPFTFPRNEVGAVEGSATLSSLTWLPTSGWFILSEDSLKFFSRSRRKDIAFSLRDIVSVDRSPLPSTLKFQLDDGSQYSFNVGDRERWLEEIEHARSTNH